MPSVVEQEAILLHISIFVELGQVECFFTCSSWSWWTLFIPFGRKTSNAFKQLMQRRIMLFLWLQAQVLVARVFSLGRQKEKLMFLGRSVLLKLPYWSRAVSLGSPFLVWEGLKVQQEIVSSLLLSLYQPTWSRVSLALKLLLSFLRILLLTVIACTVWQD